MKKPFIFATGGTGGHIFPAIAIAEEIHMPVVFAGHKIEESEFLKEGVHEVLSIPSALPTSFLGICTLIRGTILAIHHLRKRIPYAVVGFGSYHSFPLLVAAKLLRIPIILFEPNVSFGKVNKLFSNFAHLLLTQFPITPKGKQIQMPLRKFCKKEQSEAKRGYGFDPNREVVLIMGGSQGAKIFEELQIPTDIQVLHLGGKHSECEKLKKKYERQGIHAVVLEFEDTMSNAWSAADFAICRSGAMTIAEQRAYQVPTLFIPFPQASGGHQLENAKYSANTLGGGLVLEQHMLSQFPDTFTKLRNMERKGGQNEVRLPSAASSIERYHFIGAGGIGMSSLIHILRDLGCEVSGSDIRHTAMTRTLEEKGVSLTIPHKKSALPPFAITVYSSAIRSNNPELKAARKSNLPCMHRSELLASLASQKISLLVAGTHGKTSTSALLAYTLKENGMEPMYSVGGILTNYGKNGEWGNGPHAVIEADESDGSFLNLPCHSAILTNIEADHLEYYRDEKKMIAAYRSFISQVKHHLVWCMDDPKLAELSPHGISYGFSEEADVRILSCYEDEKNSKFTVRWEDEEESSYTLPIIGEHYVQNATGVLLLLKLLGKDIQSMTRIWEEYQGVGRRLEYIGCVRGIEIYDDYAHHPTEILATLKALRKRGKNKRILSLFQPHRYSRFKQFSKHFAHSLEYADYTFITDIYAAGEKPIAHVDPKTLLLSLKNSEYIPRKNLSAEICSRLREGDILITLGAGDITHVGKEIAALLESK